MLVTLKLSKELLGAFLYFFPSGFIKGATLTLCEHYNDTAASALLFQPPKLEDLGKSPRVTAAPFNSLFKVLHYSERESGFSTAVEIR